LGLWEHFKHSYPKGTFITALEAKEIVSLIAVTLTREELHYSVFEARLI
jgi:hypothetical protein